MAEVKRGLAFGLALALGATPAAAAGPKPLTPADIAAIVSVRDPQISPDGTKIAYLETRADLKKNRYVTTLAIVAVKTRVRTAITRERLGVSSPRWSPDGTKLAYLAVTAPSDDPKAPKPAAQIHLIDGAGDPLPVTTAKHGVAAFAWSPDGRSFAYVTDDDNPNQAKIDAHEDAFEITQQPWNAEPPPQPAHLWTIAATGGKPKRITAGNWSVIGAPVWSSDGTKLAFTRSRDTFAFHVRGNDVAVVDVKTGIVRNLTRGSVSATNGTLIAFSFPDPRAPVMSDLGTIRFDGSGRTTISAALDRDIGGASFDRTDGSVLTRAVDGTRNRAFRLANNGVVTTLPTGDASPTSLSVARDGTIAFVAANERDPSELYVLHKNAASPERLTAGNAFLGSRTIGTRTTIRWFGADGTLVDGVVTVPSAVTAGKKYPTVLVIHGGPTSATTTAFSDLAAFMAERGMIVFEPNYRGSDNHGARSIASAIPHVASIAGDDIERGIAALAKAYPVDLKRLGVSGWSAGGWMTTWMISHDTRWKAAMAGAAVADATGVGTLSDAQEYGHALLGGHAVYESQATYDLYKSESAMPDASKVTTPTLIITDAGDFRVPTPTSYEFYHEVRAAGTPVQLLVYPVNGHYPSDPIRRADVTKRWVEWFVSQL